MPEALPKTRPVQGSEWMVAIRKYQFDITPAEFALGSMYGTCGTWGQDVWLTDVAVADIFGVKRQTVGGWRKSLRDKGLIEVTGRHPTQPNAWRFRLTLPVDLPKLRKDEARGDVPSADSQLTVNRPVSGHPMSPERTPDVPSTDIPLSPERTQELDLELDLDLEAASDAASPSGKDQNQAGPRDSPSGDSPAEQRAWLESLRSGAERPVEDPEPEPVEDPERLAAFLGYLREHATSPETGVRPTEIWDALGMEVFPAAGDWFISRLHKEGVIRPGRTRGWYLVQSDAA